MHIYIYIYIYIYGYLSLSIYIYIYIYVYTHTRQPNSSDYNNTTNNDNNDDGNDTATTSNDNKPNVIIIIVSIISVNSCITNIILIITRKTDSIHHHPEGMVYRSFCLNSGTVAISKITSRRWWCIESLFPITIVAVEIVAGPGGPQGPFDFEVTITISTFEYISYRRGRLSPAQPLVIVIVIVIVMVIVIVIVGSKGFLGAPRKGS